MKSILTVFLFVSIQASAQIITTIAGNGAGYNGDGIMATTAKLSFPSGIALDNSGNLFISDDANNRIRKIELSTGMISTIAGNGSAIVITCDSSSGVAATSQAIGNLYYVSTDDTGNVYFSCNQFNIRKVDVATGVINSIHNTKASAVLFDGSGNMYIADGSSKVFKRNMTSGFMTLVAGNDFPGYSGDGGPATAAQIKYPNHLALDRSGNLYISVSNDVVRRIDHATGIISTFAGNGASGYSGDGGQATAAELHTPEGIGVDTNGNVYIADANNHAIRRVDIVTGIITTIAGVGISGDSGDGASPTLAQLNSPHDVKVDRNGDIYIADYRNSRIRKISGGTTNVNQVFNGAQIRFYPNPANNELFVTSPATINKISITNALGQQIHSEACNSGKVRIDISRFPCGIYFIKIDDCYTGKFVKSEK